MLINISTEVQPAAAAICSKHLASAGITATATATGASSAAAATGTGSSKVASASASTTAKANLAAPKNAGGYVMAAAVAVGALAL